MAAIGTKKPEEMFRELGIDSVVYFGQCDGEDGCGGALVASMTSLDGSAWNMESERDKTGKLTNVFIRNADKNTSVNLDREDGEMVLACRPNGRIEIMEWENRWREAHHFDRAVAKNMQTTASSCRSAATLISSRKRKMNPFADQE